MAQLPGTAASVSLDIGEGFVQCNLGLGKGPALRLFVVIPTALMEAAPSNCNAGRG